MNTDEHGCGRAESELTHAIIGTSFAVLNELGHGPHEKPYENALAVELGHRELSFDQQWRFPVFYKTIQVSEYIPDFIVGGVVIQDAKVIDKITDLECGQPKLKWDRIAL